jgi:uncharacterized protein YlxP (DUF503 family)
MKSIKNQRGMTPIGWILVFALIAFFVLLALKLVPVYISGFKVTSILESLKENQEIATMSPRQIMTSLNKRFDIDMVTGIEPDDIYIEKAGGVMTITVDYEIRKNFIGNIDFLITFNKSVEVPAR